MSYRSRFWVLLIVSFLGNMSMAVYRGVHANFALQELQLTAAHYGLLDGIREIPGLLMALLMAMTARIPEEYGFAAWGALMGAGLLLHTWVGSFSGLVLVTLIYSTGIHLWDISRDLLVVAAAPEHSRALRLGQVASAMAAAGVIAMGLVWLLGPAWPLRWFFGSAGVLALAAASVSLLMRRSDRRAPARASFVWRWTYRPLYILTVLMAAREMIHITLATYLLVEVHKTPVGTMAVLIALQGILAVGLKPLAGRLTDALGERKALALNFAAVVCLFAGYGLVGSAWGVAALYVADGVLIGFADLALSAYAARLVPGPELGATLAICSTLAHAVAVPLPAVGGLLFAFGPAVPFGLGIAIAAAALGLSLERRLAGKNTATVD